MAWVACQTDYLENGDGKDKSQFFTKEKLNENLSQGEITNVDFEIDEAKTSELTYKISGEYYKVKVTEKGNVIIEEKIVDTDT